MNTPYVKIYENGILKNPITKNDPFMTKSENRQSRRKTPGRLFSNKKGIQMVITYFGYGNFDKSVKKITTFEGKSNPKTKGRTIATY